VKSEGYEEGDMEMGAADADKHTDGNRNHDGRDLVYGVKSEEWDCQNLVVPFLFRISATIYAKALEDWKKSSTFA